MITEIIQQLIEAVAQSWFAVLLLIGVALWLAGRLAGRGRR